MAVFEKRGDINIWWFPKDFSQSRFGEYYLSGRNSCTLIALILANEVSNEDPFCQRVEELAPRAVEIFAAAINDGNAVYHRLEGRAEMQMRESRNLNIPDAIEALQAHHRKKGSFHLNELFFMHLQVDSSKESYPYVVAERLTKIFHVGLQLHKGPLTDSSPINRSASQPRGQSSSSQSLLNTAIDFTQSTSRNKNSRTNSKAARNARNARKPKPSPATATASQQPALTAHFLFVIVIADSRTTTFIFEVPNNIVIFIDSHHHGRNTGAVIAQASTRNLDELAFWFVNMLEQIYSSKPELYEISFFSTQKLDSVE